MYFRECIVILLCVKMTEVSVSFFLMSNVFIASSDLTIAIMLRLVVGTFRIQLEI
jgi:hypothetical protein